MTQYNSYLNTISLMFNLGLVPNSQRGQLDTTGMIDARGTTGFYFDHDANKFKNNITSIKIAMVHDGEILSILQIILLKNIDRSILRYCWTLVHFTNHSTLSRYTSPPLSSTKWNIIAISGTM